MGVFGRVKRRMAEKMGLRQATTYPESFENACKSIEAAEKVSKLMEATLSKNFAARKLRNVQVEAVAESLRKLGTPELKSENRDRQFYARVFVEVAEAVTTLANITEQTAKIPPVFGRFHGEAFAPYKKLRSSLEARRLDMELAKDEQETLKAKKPNDAMARSSVDARVLETTVLHDKTFEILQTLIGTSEKSHYPLQIQAMHDCLLQLKGARLKGLKAIESHQPKINESLVPPAPKAAPAPKAGPAPSPTPPNPSPTPPNPIKTGEAAPFNWAGNAPSPPPPCPPYQPKNNEYQVPNLAPAPLPPPSPGQAWQARPPQ